MRVLLVGDARLTHAALANLQSAPEIINPSPSGEVAVRPLNPVCDQNLQIVVEQVGDQLGQLTLQRQRIDRRIAILKRTIKGLALLYGDVLLRTREDGATGERRLGITHACRLVLHRADTPLTTPEVYAAVQEGFPYVFRTPGNHRASLFTTLKRLTKYGEIETFVRNGSRFWQRRQQPDPTSVGLSST
jgi:hypothetical protein